MMCACHIDMEWKFKVAGTHVKTSILYLVSKCSWIPSLVLGLLGAFVQFSGISFTFDL